MVKNLPVVDTCSIPGLGRSPKERNGNPLQLFLPGKFHGQRNLAGYSPCGCRRVGHAVRTKQQQGMRVEWDAKKEF